MAWFPTCDSLAGVVNDTLMVLITAMRKVHSDCWLLSTEGEELWKTRLTDVDPCIDEIGEFFRRVRVGTCGTGERGYPARLIMPTDCSDDSSLRHG